MGNYYCTYTPYYAPIFRYGVALAEQSRAQRTDTDWIEHLHLSSAISPISPSPSPFRFTIQTIHHYSTRLRSCGWTDGCVLVYCGIFTAKRWINLIVHEHHEYGKFCWIFVVRLSSIYSHTHTHSFWAECAFWSGGIFQFKFTKRNICLLWEILCGTCRCVLFVCLAGWLAGWRFAFDWRRLACFVLRF